MYVGTSNNNKEHKVLINYYNKLCSIIRDVNEIDPHCVTRKLISPQDHIKLYNIKHQSEQVVVILDHIIGPVKAGSPKVSTIC